MIDMKIKWNEYPSDTLYLWDGETIFRITEGSGDNLFPEDEENGYVDYWLTDYYDLNNGDGGQWMETELISNGENDMTKKTLQHIQILLDEVSDGIEEYACTLESTDVIRDPLDKIYDIIEKELIKAETE